MMFNITEFKNRIKKDTAQNTTRSQKSFEKYALKIDI